MKEALNRPDIVIAKFDATENDVPHPKCNVEGFPTFYFFKADDYDNPLLFNGGRDLEAWKTYLNEQVPVSDDDKKEAL